MIKKKKIWKLISLPLDIDDRTWITWLLYGNWSFNRATRFFNSSGVIECMPNDFKSNKSSITLFPSNLECKVCLKSWEIPQQIYPTFDNMQEIRNSSNVFLMEYVRDGKIQGQCAFKKTKERPCISPSLT